MLKIIIGALRGRETETGTGIETDTETGKNSTRTTLTRKSARCGNSNRFGESCPPSARKILRERGEYRDMDREEFERQRKEIMSNILSGKPWAPGKQK